MPDKRPPQSQSISGTSIINSSVNQNLVSGQGNISITHIESSGAHEESLSVQEMVDLLIQVENLIQVEQLSESDKVKILRYLGAAQAEIQEEEPSKELVGSNLKRMAESIKLTDEALSAGQSLWERTKPLLVPLAGWLGANVVKGWLGIV